MTRARPIPQEVQKTLQDRNKAAAFSSHRPSRLPGNGLIFSEPARRLCELLQLSIEQAYQRGRRFFLNGAMMGFDILAAEQVIAMRKKFPDIKCVTIGPFQIGFFLRNGWTPELKRRAMEVFRFSDARLKCVLEKDGVVEMPPRLALCPYGRCTFWLCPFSLLIGKQKDLFLYYAASNWLLYKSA